MDWVKFFVRERDWERERDVKFNFRFFVDVLEFEKMFLSVLIWVSDFGEEVIKVWFFVINNY